MTHTLLSTVHAPDHSLPLDRTNVEELVFREMQLTVRVIWRIRMAATAVLLLLSVLLLVVEGSITRFLILVGSTLALLGWTWMERVRSDERAPITRGLLLSGLGCGFAFQTALIVFTGGIESPFLVLYIPLMMVLAVVLGHRRIFLWALLLPFSVVVALVAVYTADLVPDLLPSFLAHPLAYNIVSGGVVLGAMIIGGSVGVSARVALNRSIQSAAAARSKTFDLIVERNRELYELSGALAHELKNPLTAIQGLSVMLARKMPESSREAEQMEVLVSEVKRMGSVLEEFLTFSRPAQGLGLSEVTPASLIDDVVTLHEAYADRRGIGFYVDIDTDLPLLCDPRKVKQVLVNLVQNALDATPDGGQISLAIRAHGADSLVFTVDDTGPGISTEMRGRLFTPGTTTKAAGSGLGLTIARAIAHQHGGTLALADRPEGGCRATFTIPIRPAPTGDQEEARESRQEEPPDRTEDPT